MSYQEKRRLLDPEGYSPVALSDSEHNGQHPSKPRGCLQALVEAPIFQSLVGAVILANAVVIGLETEEAQQDEWKAQEERGGGGENSME
ncbi:Sodium channel protein type 3 subunit alpha [Durusdinium trenchii]|uniref:Sodium channel protein type 3 subunit alpha n=1 Tax=Durusdinium trenchii TaxID=1381693 RepID=A0ABP0PTS4_9DINO